MKVGALLLLILVTMPVVKSVENALLQSYAVFESLVEIVNDACDPIRPRGVKSLGKNRDKLDDAYQDLYCNFKIVRADPKFNEVDNNGEAVNPYNDAWFQSVKDVYYDKVEKSDDILEGQREPVEDKESKFTTEASDEAKAALESKNKKFLNNQLNNDMQSIADNVKAVDLKVSSFANKSISLAQAQGIRNSLRDISSRIDSGIRKLFENVINASPDDELEGLNKNWNQFVLSQRNAINTIEMNLVEKIKDQAVSSSERPASHHTCLKKLDPPRFNGEIIEFPEFKRRWASQVHSEKLEEQAELDRLRDNVPESAKKMLTGEKSLDSAWKILVKLYGNKTMLANKLKAKLKNIQSSGKEDHDIVINLAIEVKAIVKSLTEMEMQEMLHHDDEYLSAIFRILPSPHRNKWLEYDKSAHSSVWDAMEKFLEEAHEKATDTKVLLCNYAANDNTEGVKCRKCHEFGHKKAQCPSNVTVGAAGAKGGDKASENDKKQKLKELFGKCPLCKEFHSYKRKRDNKSWPSDRFSSCEKFREMNENERADVLEKNTACSRCLSWIHAKDSKDCKAPKGNCGLEKDGSTCKGDHSRMVCNSGNAYCATTNVISAAASKLDDSMPDINTEVMMQLEDVQVQSGNKVSNGRVLWDSGSSRILVRSEFAKRMKLKSHKVKYKLNTVGKKGEETKIREGVIYEFALVDNLGQHHMVWGFDIDHIIDPPDTVDLQPVRKLFPHVPADVFDPLPSKPIDILMGLNEFGLHPDGGQGQNCVGNLKALHSKFSKGWIIAGSHPDLDFNRTQLTEAAVAIARVCRLDIKPVIEGESTFDFKPQYNKEFWESENLGVMPPKRCRKCIGCPECNDSGLIHSRKEQDELEMLQKSIKLENGQLRVSYPFIRSPECFPNNRDKALAMAIKQEERLAKKGILDKYNEELYKYVTRGVIVMSLPQKFFREDIVHQAYYL